MSAPVGAAAARRYRELHDIEAGEAAGLVQARFARTSGTLVGVYNAVEAGIETDGWATVCENHGSLVIHDTRRLALAHSADPEGWCEECREERPATAMFAIASSDIARCPLMRMDVGHFNPDGSCKCPAAGEARPHAKEAS